jgi:Holliday junction resolvase RusA-like endonuclease
MRSKAYCVNIAPIAWKRAARNGHRVYDAQARDKVNFGLCLSNLQGNDPLFKNPIHIDVIFYMPIPKTIKERRTYHSCAPDLDNLCKFVLDAIKDVLIIDDRIICSLSAKKVYDKEPRTELTITEVV